MMQNKTEKPIEEDEEDYTESVTYKDAEYVIINHKQIVYH